MRKLMFISAAVMSCYTPLSAAAELGRCNANFSKEFLAAFDKQNATGEVDIKAMDVQLLNQGTSVFTGDVTATRDGQELSSDRATYNQTDGRINASGQVRLRDADMVIHAEKGTWSVNEDHGIMLNADYLIREMHARGEADRVERFGDTNTELNHASYTTCSSGDNSWLLEADKVNLNHTEAVGTARDVVIKLGGLPVFYTPYISFPLNDQRKSGFLMPSIGVSDTTGFDLSTPYYFNIRPNIDATLSPRYMADRGLMMQGEYRYLFGFGQGKMDAGILSSDKLKELDGVVNPNYQQDRKHFTWQHRGSFAPGWQANIDYNYLSDDRYLQDFGGNLSLSSITHLNRRLDVGYSSTYWNALARLQGYQTLTNVAAPYQRLPQFLFNADLPEQAFGLNFGLRAEYVDFAHSDRVEGQRVDVEPSVSLPLANSAYFFTPRLALRHTNYSLSNDPQQNYDDNASRTLPISSIDSGLFFERDVKIAHANYSQTLEPRLFYLYVPYRDQSDIPSFDTALTTFNMTRLFAYNRFIGADRVGDANQLTLALTSRFIDQDTGREDLRMTIGQIHYFEDEQVTMSGSAPNTRGESDIITEVVAQLTDEWSMSGEMQIDPYASNNQMSSVQLRYRGDDGGVFTIGHRYRRDIVGQQTGIEQVDVSAKVPVSKNWSVIGRYYRSIADGRTLEGLAGVEYDSCCWATRFVARNFINDINADSRNMAFFWQIELKGLGQFGQNSDSLLERSINGLSL